MIIIGLIGDNRVGKDTIAEFIKEYDPSFKTLAFADPVKDLARTLFNFNQDQLYGNQKEIIDPRWNITPREVMTKLGTELMQFGIYDYLPGLESVVPKRCFWACKTVDIIRQNISEYSKSIKYNENPKILSGVELHRDPLHISVPEPNNYIITDIRFKHEVDELLKLTNNNLKNNLDLDMDMDTDIDLSIDLILIRVLRDDVKSDVSKTHLSRSELDKITEEYSENIKYVIHNNSTLEILEKKVKDIIREIPNLDT
jgi:hypothetical protein